MKELQHKPVMLDAAVAGLRIAPAGCYVDGTYGRGGHSAAILERLVEGGKLIAFDQDPRAVGDAREKHGADQRFVIHHLNFADMADVLAPGAVDGILLDLGVSSPQLDDGARGFSFLRDGPLDMRMDSSRPGTAADFVNTASAEEIATVLRQYGEEKKAYRIANAIVRRRAESPLATTGDLAELVTAAVGRAHEKKHPATRTFQALRIKVNDELGALERALKAARDVLRIGGRLVIISFHSLEDRIVKRFLRGDVRAARHARRLPPEALPGGAFKPVGRAIRGDDAEINANPRARSAILRVGERVA